MKATLSSKGQLVIPEAIREQARLKQGDEMDVGYCDGMIVLRKRRPLTPTRIRSLLTAGRDLREMTPADEASVEKAIQQVRARRHTT